MFDEFLKPEKEFANHAAPEVSVKQHDTPASVWFTPQIRADDPSSQHKPLLATHKL